MRYCRNSRLTPAANSVFSTTDSEINCLKFMKLKNLLLLSALVCSGGHLSGALISWSSTNLFQGSTTEDFVSLNGTLAVAYNATNLNTGGVNTTVNGVNFVATETGTTLAGATGETITLNGGGNNQGAFGDGQFTSNGPIFNLLSGGSFNISSVTLDNLEVGAVYEIQTFVHDARNSRANAVSSYSDGVNDGPVDGLVVNLNNINTGDPFVELPGGGTGDFAIGTFTADATTQSFAVFGDDDSSNGITFASGNSQSAINAIQLRLVTPAPEPSSSLLLGLAGTALLLRRRK